MKQKLILSLFFSSVIALSSCTAPVKVTLEFNSNGGTTIAPLTLDHGETITIPSNPSKEGFNFGGWYWDNNVFQDPFTINSIWDRPIVDRYVVFAKWATDDSVVLPGSLTITFNSNGGTPVSSVNVQKGNTVSIPATTRTGYTLDGWYTSLNGGVTLDERWSFTSNVVNNNITLYAKWNINQYTITFDTQGGSLVNSITQDFDTNINSPQEPTKLGHLFSGWNTAIPITMPASNITITATWSINSYTLIYKDFDNSNLFSENFLFNSDLSAVTITDPVRVGYTFIGWSQVLPTNMPASNITIYANYRINSYTLTLDTNGGTSISTLTLNYGSAINLSTTLKTGHSFQGWFTDIGLTQAFNLTNMPSNDLVLYAKWSINQYTINFESNEGTSIASITGNYGEVVSPIVDPTREGYTFNGWYSDANLTQLSNLPDYIPSQNLTLYAKWTINQYTISFESNGGNPIASINDNYGVNLAIPRPIKVGHSFEGWFTDIGLTQAFNLTNMPSNDLVLYAKWSINQYTISLGSYHSSSVSSNGQVHTWGSNSAGQLGDSFNNNNTRIATEITGSFGLTNGDKIIQSNLYSSQSSAISLNGRVFMWGKNDSGQLGDGSYISKNQPVEITSNFALEKNDKIISISLGDNHSVALSSYGRVFTMGGSNFGQRGSGSSSNTNMPNSINTRLSLLANEIITGIDSGDDHSAAITSKGRIFMWGRNNEGQIGNGTFTNRNTPINITDTISLLGNDRIMSLNLYGNQSSILTATGRVFMWGNNSQGQLGDGSYSRKNIPTEITSNFSLVESDKIILVSLGTFHSSALSSSGRVFMWGYDFEGQLGNGKQELNLTTHALPIDITDNFNLIDTDKFISVSLGRNHSSAVTQSGRVFFWGFGLYGQLGNNKSVDLHEPIEILILLNI
jgi:uncharacterized repeat protein (TIGR02543 family)